MGTENNNKTTTQFFSCWLPLSNLNFFHPKSSGRHMFTEGLVLRVLNVLEKANDFSINKNIQPTLFLNSSHQYFLENEEKKKLYLEKEEKSDKKDDLYFNLNIDSTNITISYFTVGVIYQDEIKFKFTVDEYGFYFFEGDNNLSNKIISDLFGGDFIYDSQGNDKQLKDNYDGILTKNQLVLLLEGVMNCDLYHRYFFKLYDKDVDNPSIAKESAKKINMEYSIDKLINRVLIDMTNISNNVNITNIDFTKIKNMGILSRYYNFQFIKDLKSRFSTDFKKDLICQKKKEKEKIENVDYEIDSSFWQERKDNIDNISYVLIQDAIEKMAMRKFLEITEQRPYFQRIKLGIETARSRMITKIMSLATDLHISQIHYGSEYEDFQFSDDKLEAYTELLLSKVPQLKNIDIMLKNSYYMKIGNTSDVDTINEMESIESFSGYQSWNHTLVSIEEDLKSLSESHQIFNDKKALFELEEIKREETSRNDFNDILSAGEQEKQLYSMTDSDRSYFMLIAVIISLIPKLFSMEIKDFGSSWIATILSWITPLSYKDWHTLFISYIDLKQYKVLLLFIDHIFLIIILIIFIFLMIRLFKPILSFLYNFVSKKSITYDVMQIIEFRNRDSKTSQLEWSRGKESRNFIQGIGIFLNSFRDTVFSSLLERGLFKKKNEIRMKKTINRISHEEKKVFVKLYTLDGIAGEKIIHVNSDYIQSKIKEDDNEDLKIELSEYNDFFKKKSNCKILKKIKVKLYIIGSFNIKIHDEKIHDIYIDTIKIYYSFNNFNSKKISNDIKEVRLKVESTFNNIFIKKILKNKELEPIKV